MDGNANEQSPAFLSRLLGINGFDVVNTATAYRGFQGEFIPGEFDLPVAVESCDLSNNGCGADYCETISRAPDPCDLKWVQGSNPVTCLDFSPTGTQNACWTAFDGFSSSINNGDLQDIIDRGNPGDVEAGDRAYLDNGSKTDTLKYLRDKFYGCKTTARTAASPAAQRRLAQTSTGPILRTGLATPPPRTSTRGW